MKIVLKFYRRKQFFFLLIKRVTLNIIVLVYLVGCGVTKINEKKKDFNFLSFDFHQNYPFNYIFTWVFTHVYSLTLCVFSRFVAVVD